MLNQMDDWLSEVLHGWDLKHKARVLGAMLSEHFFGFVGLKKQ